MSVENCGIITFSARKVTFLKVQTGKISAEGSKLFATQDICKISLLLTVHQIQSH
jgi:hypothetical protein